MLSETKGACVREGGVNPRLCPSMMVPGSQVGDIAMIQRNPEARVPTVTIFQLKV